MLSLALSVPPWEDLHRLSRAELKLTNLVTTDLVADVLPPRESVSVPMADAKPKASQDRIAVSTAEEETSAKSTKTAEAHVPTGGTNVTPPQPAAAEVIISFEAVIPGRCEASNPERRQILRCASAHLARTSCAPE